MTGTRLSIGVLLCAALVFLPSCGGGGGQGLRVGDNPILVTSTTIPPVLSGESVNHVIPIAGGCGGPYDIKVIKGAMPDGLYLDKATHAIMGYVLEDGEFDFTLEVTDSGCDPFSTTTAVFRMNVGVGEITVVDALLDGNPVLIPAGGESYNPDYPALPETVYNDYATIQLVVAGGKGPYKAEVFDHPDIPNDGPLPLGPRCRRTPPASPGPPWRSAPEAVPS